MKNFILGLLLMVCANSWAQQVIPQPVQMEITDSTYKKRTVKFMTDNRSGIAPEGYAITTRGNTVAVTFATPQGRIWAEQTLRQLKDSIGRMPAVEIKDHPRYAIRSFMHDTGRNFMEIEMLERHIDLMSLYKFNTFQWHIADNPGWRIECKAYPQLNDPQFQTRDKGKFYTYDQIRHIIAYAKERGIMVMPEIDIPGHSAYFNRTFGFSMDSEQGKEVLAKCFAEFFKEIPAADCPYMHIGSDEVHIAEPEAFMRWAQDLVRSYDRMTLAWDPGLPVDSLTIRQVWNTAEVANVESTRKPGKFLDSSMGYLNFYDPLFFVNKVFHHHISELATGGVLCLWNDARVQDKAKIELHSGMLPGMMVFAERFWRGNEPAVDFIAFEKKMEHHHRTLLVGQPYRYASNGSTLWHIAIGDTVLTHQGGAVDLELLCAANGVDASKYSSARAYTTIYSEVDTTLGAWIGFETPARSNRISGGIAKQGQWTNGGTITINGTSVQPPVWKEPGAHHYEFHTWHTPENEIPFTDEHFYWMREPVKINLRRGENKIEMTIPKSFAAQRWNFGLILF